jgi:very-short-patch-repair endonuclease
MRLPKKLEDSCWCYNEIWSEENELKSNQVFKKSHKKYKFNCLKCNHIYEQAPASKAECSYCTNRKLCCKIECIICLNKSAFCYNDIWSDENNVESYKVFKGDNKNYKFNCLECKHIYEQTPNAKTSKNNGCPFCSNTQLCCNLECLYCLNKSAYCYNNIWSDKNEKQSYEIFKNNNIKKYKFNCLECNNNYEQTLNGKTSNNSNCPYCKNKTELKVMNFLKKENIKFKSQYRFKDYTKRYDFLLLDYDLILEIDGNQHFKQVSNWESYIKTQKNDKEKMLKAIEYNMSILRIYQPDIWNDTLNWEQEIKVNLIKRKIPIKIFISKNNIYKKIE